MDRDASGATLEKMTLPETGADPDPDRPPSSLNNWTGDQAKKDDAAADTSSDEDECLHLREQGREEGKNKLPRRRHSS